MQASQKYQQAFSNHHVFPIGVVIPTYNRPEVLVRALRCLEAQTWRDFEVIVIDDGSMEKTERAVRAFLTGSSLALRYVRQENSGPARARNLAVSLLQSEVCLLLGDDILASPELVEKHLALHRSRQDYKVVGLGYTRWSEQEQTVTPFMRWLDESGIQFAYADLLKGARPGWRHFYTSNLSLKTMQLRAFPFWEEFRKAAMEDMELGYRLSVQGALDLVFLPDANAEHVHPTSVAHACRRMVAVGAAAQLFEALWPEQRSVPPKRTAKSRLRSALIQNSWTMARLRNAAALLTRVWCPNPLLHRVLLMHYARGYRKAALQALTAGKSDESYR